MICLNIWNISTSSQSILNLLIPCSFSIHVLVIGGNCFSTAATRLQMSFNMMLPVKRLATQRACIAADFRMPRVGVCTQICLVKETTPTDVAEVLIRADVKPLVFYIAGI